MARGTVDLAPYLQALHRIRIVWMTGTELGSVSPKPLPPEIDLFIYNHRSFRQLLDTLTHEVVHLVHPNWEKSEAPVDARTTTLLRRTPWKLAVSLKVGASLFAGVKAMRAKKTHELG